MRRVSTPEIACDIAQLGGFVHVWQLERTARDRSDTLRLS
jgi:hypothetical protein